MVFKTGHVSGDQLALLARGQEIDVGFEVHLTQCMTCKRRLADSLLMRGLIAKPSGRTEEQHLSAEEIDGIHKVLFEGQETSPGELLRRYRHIAKCESCFAEFFNLHAHLSPTSNAVQRAVVAFTRERAARTVGRVAISRFLGGATLKFSRALMQFAPEPLSKALLAALSARDVRGHEAASAADAGFELPAARRALGPDLALDSGDFDLPLPRSVSRPIQELALREDDLLFEERPLTEGQPRRRLKAIDERLSAIEKLEAELRHEADRLQQRSKEAEEEKRRLLSERDRVAAELTALAAQAASTNAEEVILEDAGLKISLRVGWSGGPARMVIGVADLESSEPRAGILLTVFGTADEVLASAATDESGAATVELPGGSKTIRLQVPGARMAWDMGLDLRDESGA